MAYQGGGAIRVSGMARRGRGAAAGSFIVDGKGTILGFDPGMEDLTGWPAVAVVGRNKDSVLSRPSPEPRDAGSSALPLYEGAIEVGSGTERVEMRLGCRDGGSVDIEAEVSRAAGAGERTTVCVLRVLARSARHVRSLESGGRDPLTRLGNRAAFRENLARNFEAAARQAHPLALVLADVDHLRRINDRLGWSAGERVLLKLAGILRATVGDEDLVCRLGEDDFAVLLPGSGRGEARQLAARLRSTVERFRFFGAHHEGDPVLVTLSLGAASFPADADNEADLVERAREALREARSMGRNRVWCYVRRPRVPVSTPVFFDGAEPVLMGYTRDLSPSGVFVETPAPVEIGMRCALSFPLPSEDGNVHAIGRVVRTVPPGEAPGLPLERVSGMGIEFERFGPEDRRAIDRFLHRNESLTTRPENGRLSL